MYIGMKKSIAIPFGLLIIAATLTLGYVCASAYFTFRDYGVTAQIDWFWLARSYFPLRTARPDDFWLATAILGAFGFVGLATGGFAALKR